MNKKEKVLAVASLAYIIGLFGFVFTSIQGAKFKFKPHCFSSEDISSDCCLRIFSPFSKASRTESLLGLIFSVRSTRPPSWSIDKNGEMSDFDLIS